MNGPRLLALVAFAVTLGALPGCDGDVARLNLGLNVAALAVLAVLVGLVAWAVRRQRTLGDDVEAQGRSALGAHSTSARYAYRRDPRDPSGRAVVYSWSKVDPGFPVDWGTGLLAGRLLSEMVPHGPDGDPARAAYELVLTEHKPAVYSRTEVGRDGSPVTVRYRHVPMPDGSGFCEALALSPEIDVSRDDGDRLRADNDRLRRELASAEAKLHAARTLAIAERTLGIRAAPTPETAANDA
ncbi:MAG TPA: hypothetical protein VF576_00080 [Rubricoccaceae bacterium]|jgi:hypothetical protein